jgi:cell division protein DivIC
MNDHRKKTAQPYKGVKKRLRLYLFVVLVLSVLAGKELIGQNSKLTETQEQMEALLNKQKEIQKQSEQLNLQMVRLNDPEYIGQIARKELGMSLPGETQIHVTKPE